MVAVLIDSSDLLDKYIINNKEYFFEKSNEGGIVDINKLVILMSYIK